MANLKDIRLRIKTVKNTQKVTSAMKMVSAAKLRRAQDRILTLRPYASKLRGIISNVVSIVEPENIPSKLIEQREVNQVLVVLVTSNRGLAGPFNANIQKRTYQFIQEELSQELADGRLHMLCMGKKGEEFFRRRGMNTLKGNRDVFSNLSFETVNEIVDEVFEFFENGTYDKVYLAFNEFKNVMVQNQIVETFLPLAVDSLDGEAGSEETLNTDYLFEPERESILKELIPKALRLQLFRAVLESNAAEQGARMVAMDKATENAEELLKDLKIKYNKARQAAITKEILEISAGADALAAQ
ncbi:MAG: ATP synthase F1 subunit gamma [Bacteroidota bacterium]